MGKRNLKEDDNDRAQVVQAVHQEVLHHLLNLLEQDENEETKRSKNNSTNKKIRITKSEDPSKRDLNSDDLKKEDQKIEDQSRKIRKKPIDMIETIVMVSLQDTIQEIHEKAQSPWNPSIHQSTNSHGVKHTTRIKTVTEANKVKEAEVVSKTAIVVIDDMIM